MAKKCSKQLGQTAPMIFMILNLKLGNDNQGEMIKRHLKKDFVQAYNWANSAEND